MQSIRGEFTVTANLLLSLTVLLITVGQIFIKFGINVLPINNKDANLLEILLNAFSSVQIILGIFFAGLASITWVLALTKVELSYAYPFMMLPVVLVTIVSLVLFNESIDQIRWIGMLLIIIGFWFFSR